MVNKKELDNGIIENVVNIKDYAKRMLKSDYDLICQELLPKDVYLFTEKYLNGKSDKELNLKPRDSKILKEKLTKIIISYKKQSLDNISETQIRYRCHKLGKSKEYTDFCVDAFVYKLSNKELAQKYYLEVETVKHYKVLRKKELIFFH